VVDDQEAVLKSLAATLERLGYRVSTASNAVDALRSIEASAPTLLLSDVRMPGQTGIELVAKVRQRLPELPIVMMTGFANEDVESSRARVWWLQKPFTPEKLQTTISAALRG
jgi:DNA-binding NtrC family response regulator